MTGTLLGSQEPTYLWAPDFAHTSGPEVVEFAASNGLVCDEWQSRILDGALAEDERGRWLCNEACLIVPRQNGKTELLIARELAGIFLFDEKLVLHSSHQQRTSNDTFERMKSIIESSPDLDRRVIQVHRSKGEEGFIFRIEHETPRSRCISCREREVNSHIARIRYMARTGGAGRGFPKADTVILDEAMILDTGPIAALLPTMATQPQWQVWYVGSQGDRKLPTESRVLGGIRKRGYRREPGLYMAEWAAHLKHDKTCPLDGEGRPTDVLDVRGDPRTWAKTNPAMNIRISEQFLGKMIIGGGMATWDADREFLGVGNYPTDEGWSLVGEQLWLSLEDSTSKRTGPYAVGISVARDQSVSSVSVAGRRADGLWHWECVKTEQGTAWLPGWCERLKASKPPVRFVMDGKAPNIEDVRNAVGKKMVHAPTTIEYPAWCAKMLQILTETQDARWRHPSSLTEALKHVQRKDYPAGTFVWQHDNTTGDITPWDALTLAVGGMLVAGNKPKRKPLVGVA